MLISDYPQSVKETLGSMLPTLSDEDKSHLRGSADFFALDGSATHLEFKPTSTHILLTPSYRTDISRAALNGIAACAANQSDPNWPGQSRLWIY